MGGRSRPIPKVGWDTVQFAWCVPTVADRVAQMVVKQMIEPNLDAIFLADSYGYRPGKSALDAVGVTRKRCWEYDWVLEFDLKNPLICQTGPKTSAKSGCCCSMWEKRCISGPSQSSRIVGSRS